MKIKDRRSRRLNPLETTLFLLTFFLAVLSPAQSAVRRASETETGQAGDAASGNSSVSISSDGRFVVFDSLAANLSPNDSLGNSDIFLKDLQTGQLRRLSETDPGQGGNSDSYGASLSADGRIAAFYSLAGNLVPGDTNEAYDVFVIDLQTNVRVRASESETGTQGDGDSMNLSLSADGRYVEFESLADNLIPGDANDDYDVFVKDLQTQTIQRASESATGEGGNAGSGITGVALSADGQYVAFDSEASNLVAGDTNGKSDVFVKDLRTGSIVRASVTETGSEGEKASLKPSISADGRFVGFTSVSGGLTPGGGNGWNQGFVKDLQTGRLYRVSETDTGEAGDAASGWSGVSLSAEGRYAAFNSYASNLVPGGPDEIAQVFVKDIQTHRVVRISQSESGQPGTGSSGLGGLAMTPDGSFVAFNSLANNLTPNDTNKKGDVFVAATGLGGLPLKAGDVNGDGTIGLPDVIMALQAAVNLIVLLPGPEQAADVNGDHRVDLADVIKILRVAVGLDGGFSL